MHCVYDREWNLGKFEGVEKNGTAFASKQCLHQQVAVGMETQKFNRLLGAINALGVTAQRITLFHALRV